MPTHVCDHLDAAKCKGCWSGYPQSLFPNWTRGQQKKSRISKVIDRPMDNHDSIIHYVDIAEDGTFAATEGLRVGDANKDAHWDFMRQPVSTTPTMVTGLSLMHVQTSSGLRVHDYEPCSLSTLQGPSCRCLGQSVWTESINRYTFSHPTIDIMSSPSFSRLH